MSSSAAAPALRWDLFCRVIDNFGDIGVSWRLAADLASRGQQVRLWVDDPSALRWMAPEGAPGVNVIHWTEDSPCPAPGDVVVETFGCDPPTAFVEALARQADDGDAAVWINLEYLSAEDYVERSHRLASPQLSGPGRGLLKWFYFPGFTPATGGLLREPGLQEACSPEALAAWWAQAGLSRRPDECCVSLFCYEQPLALPQLLAALAAHAPVQLLATPGAAQRALAGHSLPAGLRVTELPWVSQTDYDRLLASCDLNLVRGEDSFARAQWAARPFLWHIYPQQDGVHAGKLDAFLARHLATCEPALARAIAAWMRAWNGLPGGPIGPLPELAEWGAHTRAWREHLGLQRDLGSSLLDFVLEKR